MPRPLGCINSRLTESCAIQVEAPRGNSGENEAELGKVSASEIGENPMDVAENIPSRRSGTCFR
jgi:hypothetical protein